jgi:site-specific recombinase XerD
MTAISVVWPILGITLQNKGILRLPRGARGKNPLNVSRDDLKAFLGHLKKRDIKVSTINRLFSCLSAFYEFLDSRGTS